jgi:HD superfamily phosphodiesterase
MNVIDSLVACAAERAEELLTPLGNRWLHVLGVVKCASWVGQTFEEGDRLLLLASAYLHDIGYAPSLRVTGFHPLDGALYVRSCGYERLAALIAHHFAARFEAHLRGSDQLLQEFPRERSAVADALTYCDATTSPIGKQVSLKERAAEIRARYGEQDLVVQSLRLAMPSLALTVGRIQQRLMRCGLLTDPPTD